MTEIMQGLVSEAKKNKFSTIGPSLTDEDVVSVWDNVSGFIEKQMSQQKGVNIPGLGVFSFSQKKLDVGNNKFILIQRPVFLLSERFAQTHGLHYTKHHTTGEIPVVQLNFAALSFETPFPRDTVESCVREVLQALSRSVGAKKNVEFTFSGIGRLQMREGRVKMKFYKDFLNSMDGSGRLVDALKDVSKLSRPGTMDSVMSDRAPSRPLSSNTLVLPRTRTPTRITQGQTGLNLEAEIKQPLMPTITETEEAVPMDEEPVIPNDLQMDEPMGQDLEERELNDIALDLDEREDNMIKKPSPPPGAPSRSGSRLAVPIAKATGVSFSEDLVPGMASPKVARQSPLVKSSPTPLMMKRSLSPLTSPLAVRQPGLEGMDQVHSPMSQHSDHVPGKVPSQSMLDHREKTAPLPIRIAQPPPEKPGTAGSCGHAGAGQELCYLCHQRDRRNIPVSFTEERNRREKEEDRLLQQYQHMKDTEGILGEQEELLAKRHSNQKMAAFNLGISEAIKLKKTARPTDFHPSYIFQKRPLTPPRFIKQEKYYNALADQVRSKNDVSKKIKSDEEFLERLEQVQLAEDLAAQREQYLKDKVDQQDMYKRALSAQIQVRDSVRSPTSSAKPGIRVNKRLGPVTLPRTQIILPFAQTCTMKIQEGFGQNKRMVKFKPLPIPARVPDSSEPVFGRNDMTNESMAEKRRRAHDLYQEQLSIVEQRKRGAILKRLQEQKEEEGMLSRTKKELLEDRAQRFERLFNSRKRLEDDWARAVESKLQKDHDERQYTRSPGMLVHEQCDKYKRCSQCKRQLNNCGESNIWCESRYIPGSRLMV